MIFDRLVDFNQHIRREIYIAIDLTIMNINLITILNFLSLLSKFKFRNYFENHLSTEIIA